MNISPDTILFDRYQIREQLSKKAGRSTFLAQDLQSQYLVVVKILRFDPDFQWDDLKLFEREALTLQNLDHPAIPKYLDYFDLDHGFALVQTYIQAPSLESIIKSGQKFSEPEVIELANRLLSILTYLHEQIPPVIHRDIKPSNILLTNRSGNSIGDVYLVDFGSVQTVASKEDGTITIVGTYGYIPLEQFGGQTTIASDLYSLGMTLIYLVTGKHPSELPYVNGQIKFTAEISNRFRRWLEKMTQPHLDKRFNSDRSAQAALISSNGSYRDLSYLKPANCGIKLYRNQDRLELILPKDALKIKSTEIEWAEVESKKPEKKETHSRFELLVDLIFLFAYGVYSILGSVLFVVLVLAFFAYPWAFIGYSICIVIFTFITVSIFKKISDRIKTYSIAHRIKSVINIGRQYRLVISNECVYASDEIIDQSKTFKMVSTDWRSKFDLVIYNPGYAFDEHLDGNNQIVKRGHVTIKPDLQIYCYSNKYLIEGLSQTELYWLGQEVSDFLNLELQIIYPTPKASLKPTYGS